MSHCLRAPALKSRLRLLILSCCHQMYDQKPSTVKCMSLMLSQGTSPDVNLRCDQLLSLSCCHQIHAGCRLIVRDEQKLKAAQGLQCPSCKGYANLILQTQHGTSSANMDSTLRVRQLAGVTQWRSPCLLCRQCHWKHMYYCCFHQSPPWTPPHLSPPAKTAQ